MKTKIPIHLFLRFSDSHIKDGDTITKHNKVITRKGAIWLGKMRSPIAQRHFDILNQEEPMN